MVRVDVNTRLDKLDAAIRRVTALTGREITSVIHEAGKIFARAAGKAMPPKGKWAHTAAARKRKVFEKHVGRFFNEENGNPADIIGNRKRGQENLFCLNFGADKKKRKTRHYWQKSAANKDRVINSRDVAKAQFWRALELQGGSKPAGAYAGKKAIIAAAQNVSVKYGKSLLTPFVEVESEIKTAAGMRPFAIVQGLGSAKNQVTQWGKRLLEKQKEAFR